MAKPTITLIMKGDTGEEIVHYGYVNYKGDKITIQSDIQLTTAKKEYKFQIQETNRPKAAWVEFLNDQDVNGVDRNVRMEGLKYNDADMWDPEYEDWPGNNSWNDGGWAKGTQNNEWINSGVFAWSGYYRMGFNPKKFPKKSSTIWNPLDNGFWSAGNLGMWVYIGVAAVLFLILILVLVM